ncbi:MAG TPA: plastocyanin/azurin family copper-binding protein, partial [Longimicrobium sp.]
LVTVTENIPTAATVTGNKSGFSPATVTIAAGGTVTWTMTDEEHDVTWDGAAPAGGNVPRIDKGTSASRTFASAGTYAYHCTRHGEHASVVVKTAQASSPVFTSLSVSPSSGAVQVGGTLQLTATPRDQNGAAMAGLPSASFSTSNAGIATVSASGLVTGVAAGTATITATVTSGGTTRTATASVTVTTTAPPPSTSTATVTTPTIAFSPSVVTISAGGTVTWQISGATHNVTFTAAAPTGGNVPDTAPGGSATRTFPTAGTYDYQCTRHNGMTGRVVVQ